MALLLVPLICVLRRARDDIGAPVDILPPAFSLMTMHKQDLVRVGHHERSERENRWTEEEESDDDTCSMDDEPVSDHHETGLSADALEAHRQVLEMATTIEILTRDFENQQQELLDAYKRLKQHSVREPKSPTDGGVAVKLFQRHARDKNDDSDSLDATRCCTHEDELEALRKVRVFYVVIFAYDASHHHCPSRVHAQLLDIKDTALTEALNQRNEYRIELERAEALIKEFRAMHLDANGGRNGWKVHPTASNMAGYHTSGVAMSSSHASLAPASTALTMMMGTSGAIEVPRNERFDHESTYQRKEDDDLFWRKQYKEAVRMRKKYGLVDPTSNNNASTLQRNGGNNNNNNGPRPSLKIFSYPDNRRQKGIKDENVPFSRYIGISARQHEIIKEQHRMLA